MKNNKNILAIIMLLSILILSPSNTFAQVNIDSGQEYTIDEINNMTLGEYYSKLFPDFWNNLSFSEKCTFNNVMYSENNSLNSDIDFNSNSKKLYGTLYNSNTSVSKAGATSIKLTAGSGKVFGQKASKIYISTVLVDTKGKVYGKKVSYKVNTNFYEISRTINNLNRATTYQGVSTIAITLPDGQFQSKGGIKSSFLRLP